MKYLKYIIGLISTTSLAATLNLASSSIPHPSVVNAIRVDYGPAYATYTNNIVFPYPSLKFYTNTITSYSAELCRNETVKMFVTLPITNLIAGQQVYLKISFIRKDGIAAIHETKCAYIVPTNDSPRTISPPTGLRIQ